MRFNKMLVKVYWLVCLFVLAACQPSVENNWPVVNLWDVMITESDIPQGWQLLETSDRPIVSFGEEDAARFSFYYENDPKQLTRGGFTLHRHTTTKRAIRQYETMERAHFDSTDPAYYTPMFIPEGFSFKSPVADEWNFRCAGHRMEGLLEDRINCVFLARYGQYLVSFSIATTYRDRETVDIATIQSLIEVIDGNMQDLHSTLTSPSGE